MLFLPQMNFHTTRGLNFKNHFICIQNFMLLCIFKFEGCSNLFVYPMSTCESYFPLSNNLLTICYAPVSGEVLQ